MAVLLNGAQVATQLLGEHTVLSTAQTYCKECLPTCQLTGRLHLLMLHVPSLVRGSCCAGMHSFRLGLDLQQLGWLGRPAVQSPCELATAEVVVAQSGCMPTEP